MRKELEALKTKLGLNGIFHFAGFINDIESALQSLDIFVMASKSEGSPVALTEALAAGKPVVVTEVGGMKYIVDHNKNGIHVPPENSKEMAKAIIRLLENADEMKRLGLEARMRSNDFTLEKNVQELENIYQEVYNKKNQT